MFQKWVTQMSICVCIVCGVSFASAYATEQVCPAATINPRMQLTAEAETFKDSDARMYYTNEYTLDDFTNMTPEKFMTIMPRVIQEIRGYSLDMPEYTRLARFADLFKKEAMFVNSEVKEATTFGGVRWGLTSTRELEERFPYVCYECVDGVSAVLKKNNIAHTRVCNTTYDKVAGPQNFTMVTLCNVDFMIDFTFGAGRNGALQAGMVMFPVPLMSAESFQKTMYKYYECKRYAEVSISGEGTIQKYAFFNRNKDSREICSGTVAHKVEYTQRSDFGLRTTIQLFDYTVESAARFAILEENENGDIQFFYNWHTGKIDEESSTFFEDVKQVTIDRVYGDDGVDIELIVEHYNDVTHSVRFPDPTGMTAEALYVSQTLAEEGCVEKEKSVPAEKVQSILTHVVDCEDVQKRIAVKQPTISAFSDEDLKASALWDDEDLFLLKDRFPDGELYFRALNAHKIQGKDVQVTVNVADEEALLSLLFLVDIFKRNNARGITCYIQGWGDLYTDSDKNMALDVIRAAIDGEMPVRLFGETKSGYEKIDVPKETFVNAHATKPATVVIALDTRMSETAQGLAERLGARAMTLSPFDTKFEKKIAQLNGENVVITHSMSNNEMSENLLKVLPRIRRAGAESVALSLTYLSYARQDKQFPGKTGEAISGNAIAEYLYQFSDVIYAVTTHVSGKKVQGPVSMGKATVYNLNGFTQLVEYSFALIYQGLKERFNPQTPEEKKRMLIDEFSKRPIYIVGPDQGASLAADYAREVLQERLLRKYGITPDDVQVKVAFMKKKRLSSEEVRIDSQLYRFKRENNAIVYNDLDKPEGEPRNMDEINKAGWVFLVDDEISTGGTTKSALYVLVHEIGFLPHRIITSWVHGKFPKGLKPIVSAETVSSEHIIQGVAGGSLLNDKTTVDIAAMTDHQKRRMMPYVIATTNSYYSKGAEKKVINLADFVNVNLHRVFSFEMLNRETLEAA